MIFAAAGANGGQTTAHGSSPTSTPHRSHISADAPPFFVLHGRNDSLVPAARLIGFVDQLRQVSKQPVVYASAFTQRFRPARLGTCGTHGRSPWAIPGRGLRNAQHTQAVSRRPRGLRP